MARPSKIITKEDILRAQKVTRSNMAAARYLHVSYQHYKKYAKMYNLFDSHKNQAGKGIPKFLKGPKKMPHMIEIIEGRIAASSFDPNKLKYALIEQGYLSEECAVCSFKERRVLDYKMPLLLHFKDKNSDDFFNIKGQSITKSLMKTPINGARLSSSFGMRKHPILGYNKMHRGTDFAAPSGTPIMASGSGTITRARWCGGGGNCVKIRHNSTYETIYAHMKSFAKGIKEGRKVKQGQIIGYVGSTGISTGPHLHYEVVVNGKKVNSQRLKLPSGKKLKGEARKDFELKRIKIDLKLAELR